MLSASPILACVATSVLLQWAGGFVLALPKPRKAPEFLAGSVRTTSSGSEIRTHDLQVMGLASYLTAIIPRLVTVRSIAYCVAAVNRIYTMTTKIIENTLYLRIIQA